MIRIAVINPNSNPLYTEQISATVDSIRRDRGATIDCLTLDDAPFGIASDDDVQAVIDPLCEMISNLDASVDGIVIACFADPGVIEAREVSVVPVLGSCEAAVAVASDSGSRLGLISTGDDIPGDRELVLSYCAADVALEIENLGISVPDIPTATGAAEKMIACGEILEDQGVDVVILGCAGMATYRQDMQEALTVPVIESTIAATNLLLDQLEGKRSSANASYQSSATA